MKKSPSGPNQFVAVMPEIEEVAVEGTEERTPNPVSDSLRLLWERRRFLLRVAAWGLAISTLVAFLIPKEFRSTTRLMPPDNESASGLGMAMLAGLSSKVGSGVSMLAGDLMGIKSSGALFVGILQSRTVQDDLINKFDLRHVYSTRLYESTRKQLARNTEISEDRDSGIIIIRVTDRSADRAAAMGREYVAQLNLVVNQLSTSSAHRERVFLEERLAQVQQDLETAEKQFSEFASKNTAIDIKEQGKAMLDAAATLQGQLIAAQSELEGLKQIYTDNNVRVRTVQARITELHAQLEKLGGGKAASSDAGDQQDALYPSIRKLPILGVPFADLYRQTKVQEAVFETLTQEYELAKVQEAKEIPSVKVLDQPDIPEKKSFPPRLMIMVLGMTFAFFFGAVFLLGQARWEDIDAANPGKALALEMIDSAKSHLRWNASNDWGTAIRQEFRRVLRRGDNPPPANQSSSEGSDTGIHH